jgi:hypothetical protein
MLEGVGFETLPDFSDMAGVTFCDVVVLHEPASDGLLFHELVHAEQYRQLGVSRFAELYVGGFLKENSYDGIPLEAQARLLERRFETNPKLPFSVEAEVQKWIAENRL